MLIVVQMNRSFMHQVTVKFDGIDEVVDFYITDDVIYLISLFGKEDNVRVCPISAKPVTIDNGYLFAIEGNKICIYDYNGIGLVFEKECSSNIDSIEVVK